MAPPRSSKEYIPEGKRLTKETSDCRTDVLYGVEQTSFNYTPLRLKPKTSEWGQVGEDGGEAVFDGRGRKRGTKNK